MFCDFAGMNAIYEQDTYSMVRGLTIITVEWLML